MSNAIRYVLKGRGASRFIPDGKALLRRLEKYFSGTLRTKRAGAEIKAHKLGDYQQIVIRYNPGGLWVTIGFETTNADLLSKSSAFPTENYTLRSDLTTLDFYRETSILAANNLFAHYVGGLKAYIVIDLDETISGPNWLRVLLSSDGIKSFSTVFDFSSITPITTNPNLYNAFAFAYLGREVVNDITVDRIGVMGHYTNNGTHSEGYFVFFDSERAGKVVYLVGPPTDYHEIPFSLFYVGNNRIITSVLYLYEDPNDTLIPPVPGTNPNHYIKLYYTDDYGDTWIECDTSVLDTWIADRQTVDFTNLNYVTIALSLKLTVIDHATGKLLLTFHHYQSSGSYADQSHSLISTDRGTTFTGPIVDIAGVYTLFDTQIIIKTDCVLVGAEDISTGVVYIYRTIDAGSTWQNIGNYPGNSNEPIGLITPTFLSSDVNKSRYITCAYDGTYHVYLSPDGGQTWIQKGLVSSFTTAPDPTFRNFLKIIGFGQPNHLVFPTFYDAT